MNKFLIATALTLALTSFQPALADEHKGGKHHGKHSEEFKDLSKEERKALRAEKKAKWEAMSDSDKIAIIEKKRSERRQKMDEKWSSMSDAEKIEFVEERRKKRKGKRKAK